MRKLTTIFLAGLFLAMSVLFVTARVGQAQREENAETRPLPIPNPEVVTSVLAGRILDSGGLPISGVYVDCIGPSSTTGFVTGPDGAYRFNVSESGHYVIRLHPVKTSAIYSPSQAELDVIVPGGDFVRY